jgi:microcin C transport system substrate-binding protein
LLLSLLALAPGLATRGEAEDSQPASAAGGVPPVPDVAPQVLLSATQGAPPLRTYALTLVGEPKLPADFPHFPYANPDAPKGGEAVVFSVGSFDSFNPFILRGVAGAVSGVWETLARPNADEAITGYGHLAEVIEVGADHTYVAFELRPQARFHDGAPVTAEDVAWTFETLRDKGRPNFRQYYADVDRVAVDGPRRVVFHFKTAGNKELPLILGELSVLPKHWWQGRDFAAPLTDPPLGSGPYQVGHFEFGRTLQLQRVADWWARDIPTGRGLHNFDLRTEYFRDSTVALQAFKSGQVDFREENVSKVWATEYDFPAEQKGFVKKRAFHSELPSGMQGFVMNIRRPVFADRRVREAMTQVFDFQWMNRTLFFGQYVRTTSYFSGTEYASSGLPEGAELALLEPFRARLPAEVFDREFTLPVTDGSGNNREGFVRALALLQAAGWEVKERKLVDATGRQMAFEILLDEPSFERVALPFQQWLQRLGIDVRVRTVDPSQYQHLTDDFDFDMTIATVPGTDSPGNEEFDNWSCGSAKEIGSNNIVGVCDPAVEALLTKVVTAATKPELVASARALDRVLLWGWYLVPQWHIDSVRTAWWNRFGFVDMRLRSGVAFDAWWIDPERAAATDAARQAGL